MQKLEKISELNASIDLAVRFSEVDSLGIVWHGHYLKYFEDGREAFGAAFGLGYLDVLKEGFVIPIVKIDIDYKRVLKYGDKINVQTTYWQTESAKMKFSYVIKNIRTDEIAATGTSTQVFLHNDTNNLCLVSPEFYLDWKRKMGLIK